MRIVSAADTGSDTTKKASPETNSPNNRSFHYRSHPVKIKIFPCTFMRFYSHRSGSVNQSESRWSDGVLECWSKEAEER